MCKPVFVQLNDNLDHTININQIYDFRAKDISSDESTESSWTLIIDFGASPAYHYYYKSKNVLERDVDKLINI